MRPYILSVAVLCCFCSHLFLGQPAFSQSQETDLGLESSAPSLPSLSTQPDAVEAGTVKISRTAALIGSLTVFVLSVFVGFEVVTKVPPTLHTPLMSGSNAISGITIVGAILAAGSAANIFGSVLGFVAVVLAMINVIGGFLVTHRMLMMFKKR